MSGYHKAFSYLVVKPAKNLAKRFKDKQEVNKLVDEKSGSNLSNQKKSEIKLDASKKISAIHDKYEKKAKGGRVGLKRGTGLMKKKSNVEKIKETFGPKKDTQSKMTKKKKKFPDLTGDGKVTFADVLKGRGVINGKKKKKRFV